MGYSDHKIVFETIMLCMLLLGSTLDVVIAHNMEEGEDASKASQGGDKIKNDSDQDKNKKSSSAHKIKSDADDEDNKNMSSGDKSKSDDDGHKDKKSSSGDSDDDGHKDKKPSNGDSDHSDHDGHKDKKSSGGDSDDDGEKDKKSSSKDKKSPSGDKSQNDADEDKIKNDSGKNAKKDLQNGANAVKTPVVPRGPNRGTPEQAAWIEPQNKARAEVGLGPLTWNVTIAAYAQNYANQRAADCKLEHSDSKGLYGECIETSGPGKYPTPPEIVRWWVDEEKPFYDAGAKKCKGGVCGHYMQVINPNTNQLGCATVPCKGDKGYFSTCNYNW